MINVLRGLRNGEPGAAPSDIVECTVKISRYEYDRSVAYVNLFDIQGSGTMSFPSEDYFM